MNGFEGLNCTAARREMRNDSEAFDMAVSTESRLQAMAIKNNIVAGHLQTIESLVEPWAHRVSQPGVTEQLIRAAIAVGPLAAGQMIFDMVQKCIDEAAEVAALVEVERKE